MIKKLIMFSIVAMILMAQLVISPASYAASSYTGTWSDQYDIGSYGMNQMYLRMKDKGTQVEVEVTNDYYLPTNDSRNSFLNSKGKYRSSFITGTVTFNAKGTASFKYKDEYNNGKMTISVKKETVTLTWSGTETTDYSFPKGTFKLYKKVDLSSSESKKLGVFLSNFTELQLFKFDAKKINNSDLIRFGVWHNYINNFNSRISSSNGKLYITKSSVETSILKYFNIKFSNHRSVLNLKYNGKGYTFDGADGERVFYVQVDELYDMGSNNYRVYGHLYDPDYPNDDLVSRVDAIVKKVKKGKEYRYVLTQLSVKH
ncbi:hypothetical protein [Paenibacillus hubeiensis]|uniref:hypothetical protein n=1 Tax=Paenibacillus hubeiensis TaxID=3077330 RepID=UPI0031BA38AE